MEYIKKALLKVKKLWKKMHATQILILVSSLFILITIGYFALLANSADVESLRQGLNQKTIIYDKDGDEASKVSANLSEGVPIDDVPEHVKQAIVAIEDVRFEKHRGIDMKGMMRAFFLNLKAGRITAGGSTITQQLTKKALLSDERTYKRKLEEVFLAIEIEKNFTKDEILEMYMNQVYFGSGAYGVQNASKKYFGKSIDQVTISEGAMLAGIINRPSALDPYKNMEGALDRRDLVLSQMKKYEMISESEYDQAVNETIVLSDSGGDPLKGKYPHYVDAVINEAVNLYGLTQEEILTQGYRIYTQMDQNIQASMERVYGNDSLFPISPDGVLIQSGAIITQPQTGGVLGLIGGRGEHTFRAFNRATQLKSRQPGSVMKPLVVYTPALAAGYDAHSLLKDEENMSYAGYSPKNYNGQYLGEVPMYKAVEDSLNVPAVWLLNEIGINKGVKMLENFGLDVPKEDQNLPLALGGMSQGFSPKQLAEAYGVFPNEGERVETHIITKIIDPMGNVLVDKKPKKAKVIDAKVAKEMTSMLLNVVETGTGKNAQIPGHKLAGKTGSTQLDFEDITNGTQDQWFVGYTSNLVGAVWLGYDKTDRTHYIKGNSSETVVPIFHAVMEQAVQYVDDEPFEIPSINETLEEKNNSFTEKFKEQWKKFDDKMLEEAGKWKQTFEKGKDKLKETFKKFTSDN